jgi:hypothetical protein
MYRSQLSGRRVLVVLDNAASAEQVRPLLPGTEGCLAIITSRNRLSGLVAVDGAQRLTLDVLPPGQAAALVARIAGHERAAADSAATRRLAELCGRLPLALRIAADRAAAHPHLSMAGLAGELTAESGRLDVLATDDQASQIRACSPGPTGRSRPRRPGRSGSWACIRARTSASPRLRLCSVRRSLRHGSC